MRTTARRWIPIALVSLAAGLASPMGAAAQGTDRHLRQVSGGDPFAGCTAGGGHGTVYAGSAIARNMVGGRRRRPHRARLPIGDP